jgi:Family of unknown function (DUF6069)
MNPSTVGARRLLGLGVIAAIGAASVNAAIYGIGRAAGLSFVASTTSSGPQHVLLQHVVSFTFMTFAAGLVAALVADKVRRPNLRALQTVGAVIAVVSIAMDLSIDSTVATKATLALMHLVVGAAYVAALQFARTSRSTRTAVITATRAGHTAPVGRVAA